MADRKQEILDAALAIADERGLAAVSMRAVAAVLGVTPMALYAHIDTKDKLLDGLVERVLAGLLPAHRAEESWQGRLGAIAAAARQVAKAHPAVFPLLFARNAVTPDAVRVVDALYGALLEAGVPESEVPRLERLVSTFVVGFAISEANGRFSPANGAQRAARGLDLPGHRAVARWLAEPVDWDAEFAADLADLEGLIASVAATR